MIRIPLETKVMMAYDGSDANRLQNVFLETVQNEVGLGNH